MAVYLYRYLMERRDGLAEAELQFTTGALVMLCGMEAVYLLYITDQERVFHLPHIYFAYNVYLNVVTLYVIVLYYIFEALQGLIFFRWLAVIAIVFNILRVRVLHKLQQRIKDLSEAGDSSLIDIHPAESVV